MLRNLQLKKSGRKQDAMPGCVNVVWSTTYNCLATIDSNGVVTPVSSRSGLGLATTDAPTFSGLSLNGNFSLLDTVWDDIRILPSSFDFAGSNDPTNVAVTINGTGFRLWEFAQSDVAFATVQMPHGYKRGSVLRPHVHWTPGARGVTEQGKTVAWKLQIAYAQYGQPFSSFTTLDLTDTLPNPSVDWVHRIGSSVDYVVPGTFGESGMLLLRVYRDTGDTWAGILSGSLPLLLEVDIHYQMDKLGSDNEIPT